jgi:3-oxoacyl-[acyl-carrier protein] reductase
MLPDLTTIDTAGRFTDQVAVVTGGARGIGRAIGRRLAAGGAAVVIADLQAKTAAAAAQAIEADFHTGTCAQPVDVSRHVDILDLAAFAEKRFGRIVMLVNCAGICSLARIEDITEAEWDAVMDINLRGLFFCCQAVLPVMKRQGRGRILNLASLAGKVGGLAAGAHYSASKAGVICLTRSFARALGSAGITVNAIAPGPVQTDMLNDWPLDLQQRIAGTCPLGRLAEIDDVVGAAVFLLSEEARYITGETLNLNGGLLMD